MLPKRSTAVPPALVDRLPPIVQLPSEASDSGKQQAGRRGRLLDRRQRHAGLDGDRGIGGVEGAHPIEAARAATTIAGAGIVRDCAAAQAGVAALRHDGCPASAHARTTAATSAVVAGRTTARARPW